MFRNVRLKFLKKYKLLKKRLSKPESVWYKEVEDAFSTELEIQKAR